MNTDKEIHTVKNLCVHNKTIHDCIHGNIHLTKLATIVIDNSYFQRLRKLKQLGTACYVFPNAINTRFEHSIGTYFLAEKLLKAVKLYSNDNHVSECMKQIPELENYYKNQYDNLHPLDDYICELVKISALCHDIGHGPFSHLFDDIFLKNLNMHNEPLSSHEDRSGTILQMLIEENEILSGIISKNEIQFMKNIIHPKSIHTGFIYQIVSNTITGLDVDKFDYLMRDVYHLNFRSKINVDRLVDDIRIINNRITYPCGFGDDMNNLYQTRYRLHREVYSHKAVILIQFMILKVLILLDDILDLSHSINNMNDFCLLSDEYILESVKFFNKNKYKKTLSNEQIKNLDEATKLIKNIETRNLYTSIYVSYTANVIDVDDLLLNIPYKYLNYGFYQQKIGFVSGNKPNPFNNVYVYNTKTPTICESYKKNKHDFSLLMSDTYQENVFIVYIDNNISKYQKDDIHKYIESYIDSN
jgi:deoxynucleoside triphosphate triphosphohydrolase SAMHD1